MKKIVNIFLLTILLGSFTSCLEESKVVPNYTLGATALLSNVGGLFNLNDLSTSSYAFSVDILAPDAVNVSSVTIMKSFNGGTPVAHADITSFPANVTITPADVVNGLGVAVGDLKLGDQFDFTFKVNTNNGTFSAQDAFTIKPSCVSDLAGTYTVVTSGEIGGGNGPYNNLAGEVVLTETAPGVYEADDITGGMYPTVWGGNPEPGSFEDVCNTLTIRPVTDQWGDTIVGSGEVNEDGTLDLNWSNGYGDTGAAVYTPK
ncbi:MAG: hypothetical protein SF052_00065 [Bacteroidia bacterium]|nr:hypothetical protein [Bacteroidia bacterium]